MKLRLRSVAALAAWLGLAGFGGGYAVLAQLKRAVVDRSRWLTDDEYAEAVVVAQCMPGASGANFFTLLGLRAAGLRGALLATVLFLLPSAALMMVFGLFYDRVRNAHGVEAIFAGMNPAVVGVIASVAWALGKRTPKPWQLALALVALCSVELGVGVFEIVLVTVAAGVLRRGLRGARPPGPPVAALALPFLPLLANMTWIFLRIGASSFGGGLALVPILDHQVVDQLGWLSPREFADAVTLGQITPGPVAITATFVGFRVAGVGGAVFATVATFTPAFIATVAAGRSIEAFRRSPVVAAIFDTLAPVIVGVVAAAALSLARSTLHGRFELAIAAVSFLVVAGLRAPPLAVLAGSALLQLVRLTF